MKNRLTSILTAIALILASLGNCPPSYAQSGQTPAEMFTQQQVQGLKAFSKEAASVKLTWTPLEGASSYEIFQSTSQAGEYKQVAAVKSETFLQKGLTAGKRYYYKARALRETEGEPEYSLFSDAISAVPLPKAPEIKRLSSGRTKITITWSKVSGAQGYRIYRASKAKGVYKAVASIAAKEGCKYVNKNLKSGKRYYYKVQAYVKADDSKVYCSISQPKSIKTLTKLEAQTDAFIKKATKDSMTKEEKLRACYNYMRDHYVYITRTVVETGHKGWENQYASRFFSDKGGNCCSWAAAFTAVAKRLGYPARAVSGVIYYANGQRWGRHGFTEIKMNGKIRIFDPEIERANKLKGKKINLYKTTKKNKWYQYKYH